MFYVSVARHVNISQKEKNNAEKNLNGEGLFPEFGLRHNVSSYGSCVDNVETVI